MKNLFKALAAFQQEIPIIHKDTKGYGYTYADLPQIFSTINPLLKKHGLGFTQLVGTGSIKTIVFHCESGESIETETEIPKDVQLKGMNDFQVLGSAITYLRRYAISAILGLVTDKDNDAAGEQVKQTKQEFEPIQEWQKKQIHSLLETTTLDNKDVNTILNNMDKYSVDKAAKCIQGLKDNQPETNLARQKDINKELGNRLEREK